MCAMPFGLLGSERLILCPYFIIILKKTKQNSAVQLLVLNEAFPKGKLATHQTRVLPFEQLLSKFFLRTSLSGEGGFGVSELTTLHADIQPSRLSEGPLRQAWHLTPHFVKEEMVGNMNFLRMIMI